MRTDLKLIVVDDYMMMRNILTTLLGKIGFSNVASFENGELALAQLKKTRYDCLMMDWNMPEMSGLELLQAIRDDDELKDLPVLMITTESDKKNLMRASELGIDGYILKPFDINTLRTSLKKLFPGNSGHAMR